MRFPRCWAAYFLFLSWSAAANAHDPGLSTVQGEIRAGILVLATGFAPADANTLLPSGERVFGTWTRENFAVLEDRLAEIGGVFFEVHVGSQPTPPRAVTVEFLPGDNVSFYLEFPFPVESDTLVLRFTKFTELPPGHRQFVVITDGTGSIVAQRLLSESDSSVEISRSRPVGEPTFGGFLKLGIRHIWTGYDHLLFLFGLLVVCRTFRSSVAIISFFTVGHSLTLALATLNVVHLPARMIEPAIAASIVFVGLENLWRRGEEPSGRWALTFAFGLLHGFGFASVLRDLEVGSAGRGLAMPLFSFNLGVEIGQIAVAAIVLPVIWQLRKNATFVRRGIPMLSGVVAVAGLYWLVERTLFN